jgi:hypothetical protein
VGFEQVLQDEYTQILHRRCRRQSGHPKGIDERSAPDRPRVPKELTGLALSGGGIRSAAFCLGALQALGELDAIKAIDYLSTVSGGGFIGGAVVATMKDEEAFYFQRSKAAAAATHEIDDMPAVRHLRNYSNYLTPLRRDLLLDFVVLIRGWMANILMVLACLLILAGVTILLHPFAPDTPTGFGGSKTHGDWFADTLHLDWPRGMHFLLTGVLAVLLAVHFAVWALLRSFANPASMKFEWEALGTRLGRVLLTALVFFAVIETQPLIVDFVAKEIQSREGFLHQVAASWHSIAAALAGLSGVTAIFRNYLAGLLKSGAQDPSWTGYAKLALGKLVLYAAGLALPLLIYGGFIGLVIMGIVAPGSPAYPHPPSWLVDVTGLAPGLRALACAAPAALALILYIAWNAGHGRARNGLASVTAPAVWCLVVVLVLAWLTVYPLGKAGFFWTYICLGVSILFLVLLFDDNANSVHRLYRDRMSKAFLFDPKTLGRKDSEGRERDPDELSRPKKRLKLSHLARGFGPYPIINAALNIEGSPYLNRRGRNAEFFSFTPHFVGSDATGFVSAKQMERRDRALDLGTAMAISGAAFSSNMGRASIKPLTATLALLNVRLGYWMKNPHRVGRNEHRVDLSNLYLLAEMLGWLDETSDKVYLTDGGHIENLGLYQLLRRRCRLIIVVDAEQDASIACPSLVDAERFARIDLGVRIDLPWELIRDKAALAEESFAKGPIPADYAAVGPHAAIGRIMYREGEEGLILYVKSSLTGDENDYVLDYKRRHSAFPHEMTGDQFFGEEQFEAYRALGYHAMSGVLTGQSPYAAKLGGTPTICTGLQSAELTRVQEILGLA